ERRALRRALFAVLEAALPFQHRPAAEIVLRQLGEDRAEFHLAVAQRAETAGAVDPGLKTGIHPLAAAWVEFGILGMKHSYPLMIHVDEGEIVEPLQGQMD